MNNGNFNNPFNSFQNNNFDNGNDNQNYNGNNTNDMINNGRQAVKKVKKGWRFIRGIIKFIIFLLIVFVIFRCYGIYKGYKLNKDLLKTHNALLNKDFAVTYEKLVPKNDLKKDTDNDGLTNEEELSLKTSPFEMDSDRDGISDGAEVKKYKTDPLKFSTAGDNVSDGAKAMAGLDVLKKVSSKEKNKQREITDKDTNVTLKTNDLDSYTKYIVKQYSVDNFKNPNAILNNPIIVKNFKGQVVIPINKNSDSNTKAYYYNEYAKSYNEINNAKVEGNKVIVDIKEENPLPIVIADRGVIFGSIPREVEDVKTYQDRYLVFKVDVTLGLDVAPILKYLGVNKEDITKTYIYRENNNYLHRVDIDKETMQKWFELPKDSYVEYSEVNSMTYDGMKQFITAMLNKLYEEYDKKSGISEMKDYKNSDVYSVIRKMIYIKEYYGTLDEVLRGEIQEYNEAMIEKEKKPEVIINEDKDSLYGKYYRVMTTFDVNKNGYDFANMSLGQGGVCAGFAFTTMMHFNRDTTLPRTYTYKFRNFPEQTYNMSSEEYNSIFSKHIADYKLQEKPKTQDVNAMNKRDSEVWKLLYVYWGYANDYARADINSPLKNKNGLVFINDSNNQNMVNFLAEQFKKNKVVMLNMQGTDGAHTVNAYGMYTNPSNPNIIDVLLYDNNYPHNKMGKTDISDRLKMRLILKENKILGIDGTSIHTTNEYLYDESEPFKDDPYDYKNPDEGYTNIGIRAKPVSIEFVGDEGLNVK